MNRHIIRRGANELKKERVGKVGGIEVLNGTLIICHTISSSDWDTVTISQFSAALTDFHPVLFMGCMFIFLVACFGMTLLIMCFLSALDISFLSWDAVVSK